LKLHEYIKDLLLFREKLVLPGLGSLELHREPAKIRGKKLLAPSVAVIFNQDNKMDDGILSMKLAEAEEIDPEEARQRVLEFTDAVLFNLNKGEAYTITGVGSLEADENNTILFKKDNDFVVDFDSFGTESFELDPLISEEAEPQPSTEEKRSEVAKDKPVAKPEEPQVKTENNQPKPEPAEKESPDLTDARRKNRNTLWVLAGAVAVILSAFVIVALTTDFFTNDFNLKFFQNPPSEELIIDDNFPETGEDEEFDQLIQSLREDIDSATDPANALDPGEIMDETVLPATVKTEYHIIAGSFKTYENAKELQESLSAGGYRSLVLEKGDGIFRVSVQSFTDKNTALKELDNFRRQKGMSGAWVLSLD
jgi:cell division septation protein DedD